MKKYLVTVAYGYKTRTYQVNGVSDYDVVNRVREWLPKRDEKPVMAHVVDCFELSKLRILEFD